MSYLSDFMGSLEKIGVYEVALPFLLIFTLTFAMLQKSRILGSAKNLNVVIALVVGILFVRNQQLVALVNRFLPNVSMVIVIFLMLLLLISIFIGDAYSGWGKNMLTFAAIVSIIAIIWSLSVDYLKGSDLVPSWLLGLSSETKTIVILAAALVIIIWLVVREPSAAGEGMGKYIGKIGEELKGGSKP